MSRVLGTAMVLASASVIAAAGPAGACSFARTASLSFRGTASDIDPARGTATFRIDEVFVTEQAPQWRGSTSADTITMPKRSDDITVRYTPPEDVQLLRSGVQYRAEARIVPGPNAEWYSTSRDFFADFDEMCGSDTPARTSYADGSPIENPLKNFARRFAAMDPRVKTGAVGVPLVAAAVLLVLRRRRSPLKASATANLA